MKRWENSAILVASAISIMVFSILITLDAGISLALTTNSTSGGGLYVLDYEPVVNLGKESEFSVTYYFTNQQIKHVTTRIYYNGNIISEKDIVPNQDETDIYEDSVTLKESNDAVSIVEFEIIETDMEEQEFNTRRTFPVIFGSEETDSKRLRHTILLYQESPNIVTRELSQYESIRTRGSFEYKVTSTNKNKVDCQLVDKSLVAFVTNPTFQGKTGCTVKGTYGNVSIQHTFDIEVRPYRKTGVKSLDERGELVCPRRGCHPCGCRSSPRSGPAIAR